MALGCKGVVEHCARKRRRSFDGFYHRNNVVIRQFFGSILVMTVLIMEPVSLQLKKISAGHYSETDLAPAPIAHRTTIHVISDIASVGV